MKILAIAGCILLVGASFAATSLLSSLPVRGTGPGTGPASDEVDYVRQLPNPGDLANGSGAPDGSKISKIVQKKDEIVATYSYADGRARVVAYRLLSAARSMAADLDARVAAPVAASAPAPSVAAVPAVQAPVYNEYDPATTIVNQQPAPAYYESVQAPATPAPVVYQQPPPAYYGPSPAYYDSGPPYPAVYEQPIPAYYYVTGFSGYRSFGPVRGRTGFGGGPREGFHGGFGTGGRR